MSTWEVPSSRSSVTGPAKVGPDLSPAPTSNGIRVMISVLLAVNYIGYFKATFLLAWLGFDPTAGLASLLGLVVFHRLVNMSLHQASALVPIFCLWFTFVPGFVYAAASGYDLYKSYYLFTITLATCVGAATILNSERAQTIWVRATLGAGLLLAVTVLLNPDANYADEFGRLTAAGQSAIGVARVIGAGLVVAALGGFVATGYRRLLSVAMAAGLSVVLVQIGSRGPLLGAAIAIVLGLAMSRRFDTRRLASILAGLAGLGVLSWWALSSGSSGGRRLFGFLSGERVDVAREGLLSLALHAIPRHPFGIGWSGFPAMPKNVGLAPHPHNLLVEVLLEGGWLPGLGLIIFAVIALRRLRVASLTTTGAVVLGLAVYWLAVAQTSSDINGNRGTLLALSLGFIVPRLAHASAGQWEIMRQDSNNRAQAGRIPAPAARPLRGSTTHNES